MMRNNNGHGPSNYDGYNNRPAMSMNQTIHPVIHNESLDQYDAKKSREQLLAEINELREQVTRLEVALDSVPDSVAITDDTGNTVYMNRTSEEIFGSKVRDSLIGSNLYEALNAKHILHRLNTGETKEWKGNMGIILPQTRPFTISMRAQKKISTTGSFYVNTMRRSNSTEVNIMEICKNMVEHLPMSIAVWHQEDHATFRLTACNKLASEMLYPTILPVGKTLKETLQSPFSHDTTQFFGSVLQSNRGNKLDQFSLDGNTIFSVEVFPLPYQCVGVLFHPPSPDTILPTSSASSSPPFINNLSATPTPPIPTPIISPMQNSDSDQPDVYRSVFEFNPLLNSVWQLVNDRGKMDVLLVATNNTRSRQHRTVANQIKPGISLFQVEPLFADNRFLEAIQHLPIGSMLEYCLGTFMSVNYKPGVFHTRVIKLSEDRIVLCSQSLSSEMVRSLQHKLDQTSCMTHNVEIHDGVFFFTRHLESLGTDNHEQPSYMQQQQQQQQTSGPLPRLGSLFDKQQRQHDIFQIGFYESPIGMAIVNGSGIYIAINDSWCRILGYTTEEVTAQSFVSITHPDDVEKSVALFKQMGAGEIRSFQMPKRFMHKHGHAVWVLLTAITNVIDGERAFFSHIQAVDVLQSILNTVDLKRDDELYKQAFIKSPLPKCIVTHHGLMWNANRTFWIHTGDCGQEVMGKPFFSFFVPEDQEKVSNSIQRMVEGNLISNQLLARIGSRSRGEVRLSLLNLMSIRDVNGIVTHVACTILDTSHIQLTVQRLAKQVEN
eukprot:TRINITY_DN8590_c0_g1_i2.p1 TRINITY_DN8590_c0_g1~~TRINITY_DN8590_c0_g1_i2.p1  ORF type:complete len:835 (+),score=143.84 TRINITY_DN8590_c0_g1_i2:181-2505(+)